MSMEHKRTTSIPDRDLNRYAVRLPCGEVEYFADNELVAARRTAATLRRDHGYPAKVRCMPQT